MVKLFRTQLNPKIEQVDKFVIFSKLVLIKNLEPVCFFFFFFFFPVKKIQSRNWLVSYMKSETFQATRQTYTKEQNVCEIMLLPFSIHNVKYFSGW